MSEFKYQGKARFMAQFNRIFTGMSILFTLFFMVAIFIVTVLLVQDPEEQDAKFLGIEIKVFRRDEKVANLDQYYSTVVIFVLVGVIWIYLIVCMIMDLLELVAMSRLINATDIALSKPKLMEKSAKFFLRICTSCAILAAFGFLYPSQVTRIIGGIHLAVRIVTILCVHRFISEMQKLSRDSIIAVTIQHDEEQQVTPDELVDEDKSHINSVGNGEKGEKV